MAAGKMNRCVDSKSEGRSEHCYLGIGQSSQWRRHYNTPYADAMIRAQYKLHAPRLQESVKLKPHVHILQNI